MLDGGVMISPIVIGCRPNSVPAILLSRSLPNTPAARVLFCTIAPSRMMDYVLVIASLVALALATLWVRQLLGSQSSLPLPPGPKGLPILGNLLDLAGDDMYVKCRDWSRQFGMLLSLAVASHVYQRIFLDYRGRYHLAQHSRQHRNRRQLIQSRIRNF